MESSKWTEEEIQKQLEKMPSVKDKRSKEFIFHEIEGKLTASSVHKRTVKKTWMMPGLAMVCLLAVVLLLMPLPFSKRSFGTKPAGTYAAKQKPGKTERSSEGSGAACRKSGSKRT